jgi:hypothetical protein
VLLSLLRLIHLRRVERLSEFHNELSSNGGGGGGGNDDDDDDESKQTTAASEPLLGAQPIWPHQVPSCVALLNSLYKGTVPQPGMLCRIAVPDALQHIEFKRPRPRLQKNQLQQQQQQQQQHHDQIKCDLYVRTCTWNCGVAFCDGRLTSNELLDLLELLLCEHSIAVVDANLAVTSSAVSALRSLLEPLEWAGLFLPIVPEKLLTVLDAPVPYVLGVSRLPEHWSSAKHAAEHNASAAVWFPSRNEFWLPAAFKRSMPRPAALVRSLQRRLQQLSFRSRRRVHNEPSLVPQPCYVPSDEERTAAACIMADIFNHVQRLVAGARKQQQQQQASNSSSSLTRTELKMQLSHRDFTPTLHGTSPRLLVSLPSSGPSASCGPATEWAH